MDSTFFRRGRLGGMHEDYICNFVESSVFACVVGGIDLSMSVSVITEDVKLIKVGNIFLLICSSKLIEVVCLYS